MRAAVFLLLLREEGPVADSSGYVWISPALLHLPEAWLHPGTLFLFSRVRCVCLLHSPTQNGGREALRIPEGRLLEILKSRVSEYPPGVRKWRLTGRGQC